MKWAKKETMTARRGVPFTRGVATPTYTLTREQVENLKRAYDGPLYDAFRITAAGGLVPASQNINFYTVGLGQPTSAVFGVGGKTEADTNIRTSGGMLSLKQAFLAYELGFTLTTAMVAATLYPSSIMQDAGAIIYAFHVLFKSSSTELILGVIADWPSGDGVYGFAAGATTGAYAGNGVPAVGSRFRLRVPKEFAQGEDFRMVVNNAAAVNVQNNISWLIRSKFVGIWRDRVA